MCDGPWASLRITISFVTLHEAGAPHEARRCTQSRETTSARANLRRQSSPKFPPSADGFAILGIRRAGSRKTRIGSGLTSWPVPHQARVPPARLGARGHQGLDSLSKAGGDDITMGDSPSRQAPRSHKRRFVINVDAR